MFLRNHKQSRHRYVYIRGTSSLSSYGTLATLIRSEGRPASRVDTPYIFNSFLDLRRSGPPFSHSRIITGLHAEIKRIRSSSQDRKPAQPWAIVVGKWVWYTTRLNTWSRPLLSLSFSTVCLPPPIDRKHAIFNVLPYSVKESRDS